MRISLAYGSTGFGGRADPSPAPWAQRSRHRAIDVRRVRAGFRGAHRGATLRSPRTLAGGFEAAIVMALLAGGSAFAGYPIVCAVADSAPVRAMTPANAQVTATVTASGARAEVETTIRRFEPVPRS